MFFGCAIDDSTGKPVKQPSVFAMGCITHTDIDVSGVFKPGTEKAAGAEQSRYLAVRLVRHDPSKKNAGKAQSVCILSRTTMLHHATTMLQHSLPLPPPLPA